MMICFRIILAISFMNGVMWVLPSLCMYASLDEPKRGSAGNRRQRKFQQVRDIRVTTQSKTEKTRVRNPSYPTHEHQECKPLYYSFKHVQRDEMHWGSGRLCGKKGIHSIQVSTRNM